MIQREVVNLESTLFALASGKLPSAVAIIRVSGPNTRSIVEKIFLLNGKDSSFIWSRGLYYGEIVDPISEEKIDEVVLLVFEAPNSFTGEDVAEIQCHGSLAIVRKLESVLAQMGARQAEKGEFSYRALLNGKMGTSDIEDLSELFSATTFRQIQNIYKRRQENTFSAQLEGLRQNLIQIQAILDTAVDFSEEYSAVAIQSEKAIGMAIQEIEPLLLRFKTVSHRNFSPRLVLAGKPNAGKSSLFNLLLSRYRAVVSPEAGTTRDVIEEDIFIANQDWKLVDTAGVRAPSGAIEEEGIQMGAEYLTNCQAWLWVVDGTKGISKSEEKWYQAFSHIPHLILNNKMDSTEWKMIKDKSIPVSCKTGENLDVLWGEISALTEKVFPEESFLVPTKTEMSRLIRVKALLEDLRENVKKGLPPEYLSEENRKVVQVLESVVGEVSIEDVFDKIFSEFCIGK